MAQNYDLDDMSNFGFSGPPRELISEYFFMIILALIIFYKTDKFAKLYHDHISIGGVMVAKISLKKSIFPIFGTYPYFKFLP